MEILKTKFEKENGQLLKLSQAGRGCSGGTSCVSADDTTEIGEKPILLGKLCLRCGEFISEFSFAWAHSLQEIFRSVQTRAQALDSLGYDMIVVGVSTKQLTVLRVLGTSTAGVEASRAARTVRAHPATATMLAVRSPVVIGVLVSTILFGAMAIGHTTHLLSKVMWFGLLIAYYTKTNQKVNQNENRNSKEFLFRKLILKNFSFLLLQNIVRADLFIGSLAVFRFAAKPLIFAGGFLASPESGRGIDFSYVVPRERVELS